MMWSSICVFIMGTGIGYATYVILALRKRRLAYNTAEKIITEAVNKAANRQNAIRNNFLQEKSYMQLSIESLCREVQDSVENFAKSIEELELEIENWQSKLQQMENDFDEEQQRLCKKRDNCQQLKKTVKEIEWQILQTLLDRSQTCLTEMREKVLRNLQETIDLECEVFCNRHLENLTAYAERMAKRILMAVIHRYQLNHMEDPRPVNNSVLDVKFHTGLFSDTSIIESLRELLRVGLEYDADSFSIAIHTTDGYKREITRRILEKIQHGDFEIDALPTIIDRTCEEIELEIEKLGFFAASLLDIDIPREIAKLLGRLKYRTSFGQNVLYHSIEVAYLAKLIAAEIGLDSKLLSRAGLLHDIGKAVDHEKEGGHPEIGGEILKKFGEKPEIIEGVTKHHEDIQQETPYATVISAADAISAARPGARRETFETYITRLQSLESIAQKLPGIENAFAISAGRELRVMVNPNVVNDQKAAWLAKEIARKIELELHYPGKVKITVIREMTVAQYAI